MREIYFDNGATTKALEQVFDLAKELNNNFYGNPSSLHTLGIKAEKRMNDSILSLADILEVSKDELYFTSGGTLANAVAIFGTAKTLGKQNKHIITTKVEHPSVADNIKKLEEQGFEVSYVETDEYGNLDFDSLENLIKNETVLVSIMHINNETGIINDIEKASKIIKDKNPKTLFHSDGVQGFGKQKVNFKTIDMYSFSSHKIHGIKGVGGLYIKKGLNISPLFFGGTQQKALVPGTENFPGIVILSEVAKIAFEGIEENYKHVLEIKEKCLKYLLEFNNIKINGNINITSPYILNISCLGIRSETMLHALAEDKIYISAGSACNSKKNEKNIIYNYGFGTERSESALRLSFSKFNTLEEVDLFFESFKKNIEFLSKFSKK